MGADSEKAIRYMQSLGRLEHTGACLYYVWKAFAYGGASTGLSARTATEAWGKTLGRHPGDRNPPRGAAVWWGAKPGSAAGDVVISLGGGQVIATDQPRYGVVGEATIAEREQLIGRPYLGWSDHIFDAPIDITSTAVVTPIAPSVPATPEEDEDDMKNSGVYYEPSKGTVTYLLFNTGSGWYHEFSNGAGAGPMPSDYNNALAGTLGTGSWAKVTASHAAVIKTACDAVRRTTLAGSVSVDVNES